MENQSKIPHYVALAPMEDADDPTIVITFATDIVIHNILGLPGVLTIPPQVNVPQLAQQATAALSKQNLVNWLDAIFEICSNAGKRSRNQAGQIIQGTYEGLMGHEYGRMECMISNTLPLLHDLTDPAAPLSAGQFRVYWGGGRGSSSVSTVKLGPFLDN